MSLSLDGCLSEAGCEGLTFKDTTGAYDATDNAGGYGAANDVTDPSDFDTYTISLWHYDLDPATDDPTATYDLLASVPAADNDGYYSWTITLEDLGLEEIESGIWYVTVTGVKDGETYSLEFSPILTEELAAQIDAKLKNYDPSCPCKKHCADPLRLWQILQFVRCAGMCSEIRAKRVIAWLKTQVPTCC